MYGCRVGGLGLHARLGYRLGTRVWPFGVSVWFCMKYEGFSLGLRVQFRVSVVGVGVYFTILGVGVYFTIMSLCLMGFWLGCSLRFKYSVLFLMSLGFRI